MKKTLHTLLGIIISAVALVSCQPNLAGSSTMENGDHPSQPGTIFNLGERVPGIAEIVFAGKVVDPNSGEWANNRLVLLFLKSKEIARDVTSTREYDAMTSETNSRRVDGGLGIADGIFVLHIQNTYELLSPESSFTLIQLNENDNALATWADPLNEGDFREFYVPAKNLKYTLVALSGELSQLPAEIQQSGSVALLDGNRLVAVDPNSPEPTPPSFYGATRFEQITESVDELSNSVFPINNCGGATDVKQEITHTYIHEIIDETSEKLGIEIPIIDWLKIVAEVGKKYGTSDKEITSYSTTLIVPAGKNIEYTVLRKQVWENGVAIIANDGIEISGAYRILKNEVFEVANSEQKSCP